MLHSSKRMKNDTLQRNDEICFYVYHNLVTKVNLVLTIFLFGMQHVTVKGGSNQSKYFLVLNIYGSPACNLNLDKPRMQTYVKYCPLDTSRRVIDWQLISK